MVGAATGGAGGWRYGAAFTCLDCRKTTMHNRSVPSDRSLTWHCSFVAQACRKDGAGIHKGHLYSRTRGVKQSGPASATLVHAQLGGGLDLREPATALKSPLHPPSMLLSRPPRHVTKVYVHRRRHSSYAPPPGAIPRLVSDSGAASVRSFSVVLHRAALQDLPQGGNVCRHCRPRCSRLQFWMCGALWHGAEEAGAQLSDFRPPHPIHSRVCGGVGRAPPGRFRFQRASDRGAEGTTFATLTESFATPCWWS